jgi:hypothetical protein
VHEMAMTMIAKKHAIMAAAMDAILVRSAVAEPKSPEPFRCGAAMEQRGTTDDLHKYRIIYLRTVWVCLLDFPATLVRSSSSRIWMAPTPKTVG